MDKMFCIGDRLLKREGGANFYIVTSVYICKGEDDKSFQIVTIVGNGAYDGNYRAKELHKDFEIVRVNE